MARFALSIAALLGFLVTAAAANLLVPALRRMRAARLNRAPRRDAVLETEKAGVPTMGGLALVLGVLAAVGAAWLGLTALDPKLLDGHQRMNLTLALAGAFAFGAVGFADDYLREAAGRRDGLRAWQRLVLQALVVTCFLAGLYYNGVLDTGMVVPFVGYVDFGRAYYPLAYVLILWLLNGAALPDAVGGASAGPAFAAMLGCAVVCGLLNYFQLAICAAAAAGGLLAFLLWNFAPAKVSGGRTGCYFWCGLLISISFCMGWPSLLLLFGGIYLLEGLVWMLQGVWFALRRKLLFAAAPLYAALLHSGWSEAAVAAAYTGMAGALTLLALLFVRIS